MWFIDNDILILLNQFMIMLLSQRQRSYMTLEESGQGAMFNESPVPLPPYNNTLTFKTQEYVMYPKQQQEQSENVYFRIHLLVVRNNFQKK